MVLKEEQGALNDQRKATDIIPLDFQRVFVHCQRPLANLKIYVIEGAKLQWITVFSQKQNVTEKGEQ